MTAMHGHLACLQALLAAGADPNRTSGAFPPPLILAASAGHTACVETLIAHGANPAAHHTSHGGGPHGTALHAAGMMGWLEPMRVLLAAAPQLALQRDLIEHKLPLDSALEACQFGAARYLLEHALLPPAARLLDSMQAISGAQYVPTRPDAVPFRLDLNSVLAQVTGAAPAPAPNQRHAAPVRPLDLYAPLVARQPLTSAEWARVPSPCPALGAALPAVLERGEDEAALLVQRLPAAERERLRTAALCLRRVERSGDVSLPTAIVRSLLLSAVE